MGIFDNATSVTINNKEVASMKIGEATIYEKEVAPTTRTVHITCTDGVSLLKNMREFRIDNGSLMSTDENAVLTADLTDGSHTVTMVDMSRTIVVDEDHTTFSLAFY